MDKLKQFLFDMANWDMKKSELKNFIHANWFFSQAKMNLLSREEAQTSLTNKRSDKAITITDWIPEWDSIYIYEGIISQQYGKWEKNRNGYKIDKNWWKLDEYMYNPAILLMHDPEKGVIGNMVKVWVTNQWLKWLFRVDVNNISDEWIKNQIKTWTLKASSTWSLVDEYMLEDVATWKNYTEEKAIELYWEREVVKAFRWMDWQLILNITWSVMLETSLVTLGSNYKAVSDTIGKYFSNIINNRMTPEQIEALKNQNAADTTTAETQEGENPEGTDATTTTSENDVEDTTATTDAEETTENTETTDDVSENNTTEEDTHETQTPSTEDKWEEVTTDALKSEIEALRQENADLKNQINTPVVNTSVAYSQNDDEEQVAQLTPKEKEQKFLNNMWGAKI